MVYTQERVSATVLNPSFELDMGSGVKSRLGLQYRGSKFLDFGLSKELKGLNFTSRFLVNRKQFLGVLEAQKVFKDNTQVNAVLTTQEKSTGSLKLKKKLDRHTLSTTSKVSLRSGSLGFRYTNELNQLVHLKFSAKVKTDSKNLSASSGVGACLNLSEHSSVTYKLETHQDEVCLAVKLRRGGFKLNLPLSLSYEKHSKVYVLGLFLVGIVTYFSAKIFKFLWPESELKQEETTQENIQESQMHAHEFSMMVSSKARTTTQQEETKRGLVILKALFGHPDAIKRFKQNSENPSDFKNVVDVTVPLQFLVEDSKLMLSSLAKSQLNGFYNPVPEQTPQLLINYKFREETTSKVFGEEETVTLP